MTLGGPPVASVLPSGAIALGDQLQGDVDDHVFLPADVAGLADPLQDLVRRTW